MSVQPLFLAAGWYQGRRVRVPQSIIAADHPAAIVMAEFGGLTVGKSGPGEECATKDVGFCEVDADESIAQVWAGLLDTNLVGLADVCQGHAALYMDTQGRYYGASLVHDAFWLQGASFAEAMERLLLGRRPRPMLRPDQLTVMMFGEKIARDHPSVYRYR